MPYRANVLSQFPLREFCVRLFQETFSLRKTTSSGLLLS